MSEVSCPFTLCGQTNMTERCSENSTGACGLGIDRLFVHRIQVRKSSCFCWKKKKHNMPLKWKGLRCFENDMRKESVGGFWSKHPFITNILYWVNILNKISMELIKSIYNITYTGLLLCVNNMPRLQYLCSYPWLRFAVIGNSLGKEYIYKITCIPILLLHVHVVRNYITIWRCFTSP